MQIYSTTPYKQNLSNKGYWVSLCDTKSEFPQHKTNKRRALNFGLLFKVTCPFFS